MKVSVKKDGAERIEMDVSGVSTSFMNALRRYVIAYVPTLAIDTVTVYENTTHMFDEFIAHRLGMVPIKTPARLSEDEEVVLTLDVQGPKIVYSGDLKSSTASVPVKENILLFTLEEGYSLRAECKAKVGTGHKHAKFQPGLAAYEQTGDDSFSFFVESFGHMPAKKLLTVALDKIGDACDDLTASLKKA